MTQPTRTPDMRTWDRLFFDLLSRRPRRDIRTRLYTCVCVCPYASGLVSGDSIGDIAAVPNRC